jgi:hypothetical protein
MLENPIISSALKVVNLLISTVTGAPVSQCTVGFLISESNASLRDLPVKKLGH